MKHLILILLAGTILTACTMPKNSKPSGIDAPAQWSKIKDSEAPFVMDAAAAVDQKWWTSFEDPALNALIGQAMANNKTLAIAKARIEEARALRLSARSALMPQLNLTGGAGRGNQGLLTGDQTITLNQASLEASWEIDLFGRNQARVAEAAVILQSEEASRQAVMVGLSAEVARTYFDLRNYETQLDITKRNLETQQKTAKLIDAQLQGAMASDFDVQRARAQVSTTEAIIPALQEAYDNSKNRLSVLLGIVPGTEIEPLALKSPLKPMDLKILVSAPATVLATRPDIKAAERIYAARASATQSATAELLPQISLLGLFGIQDTGTISANPWNLAASLVQPVLNFGRIQSKIDAGNAREEQAFLSYQQTVLEAVEDMENALSGYLNEFGRNASLQKAFLQNQKASELSKQQYKAGYTSLLDVLVSDRNALNAEADLAASDAKIRKDLVNIYAASGGGWQVP